jgi:hypothetical protein
VNIYQTTRRHILDDITLQNHSRESLKSNLQAIYSFVFCKTVAIGLNEKRNTKIQMQTRKKKQRAADIPLSPLR